MKRLIAIFIVFSFMLVNITIDTYAFDWKSMNLQLVNQTENDSQTILELKDKQERLFKVIYQDETMMLNLLPKIIQYKNEFYSWQNIKFKDISFMAFASFLDVVIIPQEVVYNNNNLATAIPAGITMTFDPDKNILLYDFRIMKDNQFIRISGVYAKEDKLLTKIGLAYDNPAAYLQSEALEPSQSEDAGLNNEKILQALIYLYNEDWNGRQKTIPIETIHKVVELRQNNPGLTKTQLWKVIRKERIAITKREMNLILILYFNEFD